jgi:hypothetical protein
VPKGSSDNQIVKELLPFATLKIQKGSKKIKKKLFVDEKKSLPLLYFLPEFLT